MNKEPIQVDLKRKHFTGARYSNTNFCPAALAIQEMLKDNEVSACVSDAYNGKMDIIGKFTPYRKRDYDEDYLTIKSVTDSEAVIRTLIYTALVINS